MIKDGGNSICVHTEAHDYSYDEFIRRSAELPHSLGFYMDLSNLLVGPRQSSPAPSSPSLCLLTPCLLPPPSTLGRRRHPQDKTGPSAVTPAVARVTAASAPSPLPRRRHRYHPSSVSLTPLFPKLH